MGINKPNVRFIIHQSMPKSMENYIQETGRAGRDGKPATCILFYDMIDIMQWTRIIYGNQKTTLSETQKRIQCDQIICFAKFCAEKIRCRREMILSHFNQSLLTCSVEATQSQCDNCEHRASFETKNVTTESQIILGTVADICSIGVDRLSITTLNQMLAGEKTNLIMKKSEFVMLSRAR